MKKVIGLLSVLPLIVLASCSSQKGEPDITELYPKSVLNSEWGLDAACATYDALGLALPYIEQESFEYSVEEDDYGDPAVWFYCYYKTDKDAEDAFVAYQRICELHGFSGEVQTTTYIDYELLVIYEFDVCYCDRIIFDKTGTKEHGVELQFLVSTKDNKPCLGIYGFTYVYCPEDVFPTVALDAFYGENGHDDVPTFEREGAIYSFYFDIDKTTDPYQYVLFIAAENVDYTIEEEYFNALKKLGYTMMKCNDLYETYDKVTSYDEFDDDYYYAAMKSSGNDQKFIIFDFDLFGDYFIVEYIK